MPTRTIIGVIVGVVAVLALTTALASPGSVDDSLASIARNHTTDNTRAQGAPQQQVVNGWTTHEYLALIAEREARTERTVAVGLAALSVLFVLGLFRQEPAAGGQAPVSEISPDQPSAEGPSNTGMAGGTGDSTFPAARPASSPPPP